jgi:lysyl endopeptidase
MKQIFTLLLSLCLASTAFTQISHGGRPMALDNDRDLVEANFITMPEVDVAALEAEDSVTDLHKDIPYRFGHNIPVNIGLDQWTTQDFGDGSRIMRLGIESPGAVSINFTFSEFDIPTGAKLFVYDANRTHFIGSFTHENMQSHGGLAISLIFSDKIIVEYFEPAKKVGLGKLHIDNITHGYRGILGGIEAERGPFGNSGSCNINVACPLGADWQDQIRAVTLIVVNGNAACTGALVNNTAENGIPYYLTANHCTPNNNNYSNWIFYFNHQTANCVGNNGPTNQTVTGATFRAKNAGSDFALIELNSTPPANFNVFYSGWDRNNIASLTSVGIHHPSGDLKKICKDEQAVTTASFGGADTWRIINWEQGTTEPGSSGSPLFNQNGHIVGQLYGGSASCSSITSDYYGKFSTSWNGNSPATRLRDWLDPLNTNVTVLNGLGGAPVLAFDAALLSINNIDDVTCGSTVNPSVTIRNNGTTTMTTLTLNWTLNGTPGTTINWTGSLTTGQQANVNLPAMSPGDGNHTLQVVGSNPNGQSDGNVNNNTITTTFTLFANAVEYTLNIILDDYGDETTWEIKNSNNVVIYTGGPYAEGADQTLETTDLCLGNGCYTFTIFDSWGDGICCQYGDGSYEILDNQGNQLFTGGTFTNQASHNFCITSVGIEDNNLLAGFSIFPNPAANHVFLNIPDAGAGIYTIELVDLTGRVLRTEQHGFADNNYALNISGLTNGMYMVRLSFGTTTSVKQLVIAR